MPARNALATEEHTSSGGRLVTADGRELPLRAVAVQADACGGLVRVVLEQRFVNPHADPLAATYQVPLPADGAVGGYLFHIGERRVVGEVEPRARARERFEEAILEGRGAALLEQERSSLFTQEIGNIPPHAEVRVEITIDQRLYWLADGEWEWRFPTVVAPRYLGTEGRVADAARVSVEVTEPPLPVTLSAAIRIRDQLREGQAPRSPSHALRSEPVTPGVMLHLDAAETPVLDRDVVVRWPVARHEVGVTLDVARPPEGHAHAASAYALLTLVPPTPTERPEAFARDVCVLLDTSGSMHGAPLDQARSVVGALVDSLTERDRLELIAFSTRPYRWQRKPVNADAAARAEAREWLAKLQAAGGTEMRSGVEEALRPLRRGAQRQVVLVTDGLIGFETETVDAISRRLPAASRLHTVGVGEAVNRSLTAPAARAGRGTEVIVGLADDPGAAVRQLLAHTHAPLAVELEITGDALRARAPGRLPDLLAAGPARVALELDPAGGELHVRARTPAGDWQHALTVPALAPGEGSAALPRLFAREAVEDREVHAATSSDENAAIELLGVDFQIATRLTSWVAIAEEAAVDPRAPTRRERIPQSLPHGMSIERLGLRTGGFPDFPSMSKVPARKRSGMAMADWTTLFREMPERTLADAARPLPHRRGGRVLHSRVAQRRERGLHGRIVLRKPDLLVVEIEVTEMWLYWHRPGRVEVVDAAGQYLRLRVLRRHSTRSGWIEPGQRVRLALRLTQPLPEPGPRRIEIGRDEGGLRIEL